MVRVGLLYFLKIVLFKHLQNGRFFKNGDADDLEKSVKGGLDTESFFRYGHQHVCADRNPDLCLDRVLRIAEKAFDPKMLFDPLEKTSMLQRLLYTLI